MMKIKVFPRMLFVAFFAVVGLSACHDDEPQDAVKEIRMQISSETGIMYDLFDDKREHPIECMLVMSDDNPGVWSHLRFNEIEGFTYERGHEYYLSVRRTLLANPPADASDRTYSLIRILDDRLVTEPEVPVEKEIKSEADIEYNDLCPFGKYAISKEFSIDENGRIFDDKGSSQSYKSARIWLEDVLDKADPNWARFNSVPYQADCSFVLSPFTDDLRLVSNHSHGPMFKEVVTEDEFSYITQSMKSGEGVRYALILANHHKKGLQKFEFLVKKR